ncbi:serine protease [Stagnimonas aquatica]|uniref:Serine protease n=1 Tax=Stagnimonas aquatica TaxID=2689987 RepID=A0A3N0VGN9_9GAMM|nr:serine protease [Stagnimonas aquatica]ROH91937.1 serine protease [Stagnimonas aquatica]
MRTSLPTPLLLSLALASAVLTPAKASQRLALTAVPQTLLTPAEVRAEIGRVQGDPLRYAVAEPLNLDQRSGAWDQTETGLARWRLRIASDGARSLSLHLRELNLPQGAQLWLYDASGSGDRQGPYDRDSAAIYQGELWLPVVRASEAVLEVQLPMDATPELHLAVAEAFHGFRSLTSADGVEPKASIGSDSGSCNIDVVCSAGNDWRSEIRSTVLLSTAGVSLCSGSLVSNTAQDDRPLILTANHCGIRSSNVRTVTAYFNLQSGTCGGNQNGRTDQNLAGASFLARDENSDFTLFTLASKPPSTYNAYYAGWDARSGVAPQCGVAIHHPSGDEKKISVYNSAATPADNNRICQNDSCSSFFTVDAWRVVWTQGTTEAGSSGAALWNQDHRVVGVLSGGGASCSARSEPDYFARLERGWTANSSGSGQLKAHLDPNSSGCLTLSGKNPGSASPVTACSDPPPSDGSSCAPDSGDGGGGSPGPALLAGLALLAISRRACRAAAAA